MMLLDGCWMAVIYYWGITALRSGGTRGWLEMVSISYGLGVTYLFLIVCYITWLWAMVTTASQAVRLWISQADVR